MRIWTYEVVPGAVDRFVRAYGPDGDRARLFAQADGHAGTELLRSEGSGVRFLTVDRWRDEASWEAEAFRSRWSSAHEALDLAPAPLTSVQVPLLEGAVRRA
jgi:heme-degrading monooxygenase HmoA